MLVDNPFVHSSQNQIFLNKFLFSLTFKALQTELVTYRSDVFAITFQLMLVHRPTGLLDG